MKSDIDFGRTAEDYASYRAGFPKTFFKRIEDLKLVSKGSHVLDLGTGTGTIARGIALLGAEVTGLDRAHSLIEKAKELDKAAGVSVHYVIGQAEQTGLPHGCFDFIIAGQCWHWFNQDETIKEIRRLLKPQARFAVAYFDWISYAGNPVDEMLKLRKKYNPEWDSLCPFAFYPQKPGDLKFNGFVAETSFFYVEDIPYTYEAWRGRIRSSAGIGGNLPSPVIDQFDQELASVLKEKFRSEPMLIPHKVWAEIWRLT